MTVAAFIMGFQKVGIDEFQVAENSSVVIDLVAPLRPQNEDNCDKCANKECGACNGNIVMVKAALDESSRATGERAHGVG